MGPIKDLTGSKYGRLEVVNFHSLSNNKRRWNCVCECGKTVVLPTGALNSGNTKSCGCLMRDIASLRMTTHGLYSHPLHNVWILMLDRCRNKNCTNFKDYGGRGITVCSEWYGFLPFYNWAINNGWEKGLFLDRQENNGNYEPGNCRFVTRLVNNNNKRNNIIITYQGKTLNLKQWSTELNINYGTLKWRMTINSTPEILFKPVRLKRA